ncbi:MAG: universal stress protein, partial [Planctomycetaceae bacterium]|nr:universal stress protein [Planctomycetaceae bacterium]
MIQKFLTALDGSKASESILPYLETLLGTQDADVTLAQVVPFAEQGEMQRAHSYLSRISKRLRDKGAVVNVQVLSGTPASALVELATRGQYSVILMCSHVRKGLPRLVLGSVAEEVLRLSPVPVLVVHPLADPNRKPRFKRIVVPLDGSHRSASILPHVASLAKATGSKILFMTTVDPRTTKSMPVDLVA